MKMDETLKAPVLESGSDEGQKEHFTECFVANDRLIKHDYSPRLYKYKITDKENGDYALSKVAYAGICPDFELNQPYYNQIFNGGKFRL